MVEDFKRWLNVLLKVTTRDEMTLAGRAASTKVAVTMVDVLIKGKMKSFHQLMRSVVVENCFM